MSEHKAEGMKIVRRTHCAGVVGWTPDVVCGAAELKADNWGTYASALLTYAMGIVAGMESGLQLEDADLGMMLWRHLSGVGPSLPCREGVGPSGIDLTLDERVTPLEGRDGFRVQVDAYQPSSEDRLPNGTRLPVTDLDRLTSFAGKFTFTVDTTDDKSNFTAEATGVFGKDEKLRRVVESMNA
jgi:hypothetical protein